MQPFLIGAGAPNGPILPADLKAINDGGFKAVKLYAAAPGTAEPMHTIEDVLKLRAETHARHFLYRAPDSIWRDEAGRRFIPSWLAYCDKVERLLGPLLMAAPDADVQLDCEPNVKPRPENGNPGQWPGMWFPWANRYAGAGDWRAWMENVLNYLLPRYPDVSWCYTPMAWQEGGAEDWMFPDLIGRLRTVIVDSYWQSERTDPPGTPFPPGLSPMWMQNFGANAVWVRDRFQGKRIIAGEFGNSLTDRRGSPQEVPPARIQDAMRRQYPLWLRWARMEPTFSAAYLFIIGGVGWEGFNPGPDVLAAIANTGI